MTTEISVMYGSEKVKKMFYYLDSYFEVFLAILMMVPLGPDGLWILRVVKRLGDIPLSGFLFMNTV